MISQADCKIAYDKANALYNKAEAFIKSKVKSGGTDTNKLLVGPALADLDEATNILTDALIEKPAPADELWLTGLRAECFADMAVWSVNLGDAKNYAQQSIDDLTAYLAFTGQNQPDIDHAKFLLSRMQGIISHAGIISDITPNWSATVGGGKLAYLDDSVVPESKTDYTVPIAIGVGVVILAGIAVAVKHHAAVTAHGALTANPNKPQFVWKKHYERHNCSDGNFPCGTVYFDVKYDQWVASPRVGIDSLHNSMKSAKLRIEKAWLGR